MSNWNKSKGSPSQPGREGGGGGGGAGVDCVKSVSLSRFVQWKHAAKNRDEEDCDRPPSRSQSY